MAHTLKLLPGLVSSIFLCLSDCLSFVSPAGLSETSDKVQTQGVNVGMSH